MKELSQSYNLAQRVIADLKMAIHNTLFQKPNGLSNAEIGRLLGIYHGHSGQHEGHISRVLLEHMRAEGTIEQNESTKKWALKNI
ncbi:MAG TPA: hypothetical protein VFL76_08890 [Edaphocola sp.]|nr:hypothetical protein [Edaphocola sp.]